jgi:hypothetical protein
MPRQPSSPGAALQARDWVPAQSVVKVAAPQSRSCPIARQRKYQGNRVQPALLSGLAFLPRFQTPLQDDAFGIPASAEVRSEEFARAGRSLPKWVVVAAFSFRSER